jgi:hypothetical protein
MRERTMACVTAALLISLAPVAALALAPYEQDLGSLDSSSLSALAASGQYRYVLTTPTGQVSRSMVLLK